MISVQRHWWIEGQRFHRAVVLVVLTFALSRARVLGQGWFGESNTPPQRILVKFKKGRAQESLHRQTGARLRKKLAAIADLHIVEVPAGRSVEALLERYRRSEAVAYAEADHTVHALLEPNDPSFENGDCWHLRNIGLAGGVTGADIDAAEAWSLNTDAPDIVVAVLDSGIRYTHQDLAPNMWQNPGEIPDNGVDDDGNGYVDDVYGVNVLKHTGNPNDDYGHGTHVAGIIGAVGNNGVGVAGICWQVRLMACKFINSIGDGSVSDAIECIDYAIAQGAKIINLSWGDPLFNSQALYDAIASAREAGVIVVCAAGNETQDNDQNPLYPACFDLDNIISVAATTRRDELASFSSYGLRTTDLGAPGDPIYSCWNASNNSYHYLAGSSMAAPMVAGACALVWERFGSENYREIISRILANVDRVPSLEGKCVTGGRLNLQKALAGDPPTTVTVVASDETAVLNTADTGSFTFHREGGSASDLTVRFQLNGTAVRWDDYRRPDGDMPTSFVIPAGHDSATLTIEAVANSTGAEPETVLLTLEATGAYQVGSPGGALVTILTTPIPLPAPRVEAIDLTSPDHVVVSWSSVPGVRYQVQGATAVAGGVWKDLSPIIMTGSERTSWTNEVSGMEQYFYMVKMVD